MAAVHRNPLLVLAISLVLVGASRVGAAQTETRRSASNQPSASERALAAAAETAAALGAIPVPEDEFGEASTELPPEAERLLRLLHRRLAAWAVAWLDERRDAVAGRPPEEIEAGLHAKICEAGLGGSAEPPDPGESPSCRRAWFGPVLRLRFDRPQPESLPRHHGLMIALGSGLVEDAALYVLERGPKGFHPVLEWSAEVALASKPLAEDDPVQRDSRKGLNELDYQISPPDDQGRFFVFAVSRQPGWPSSRGAVSFAILRPGPDERSPRVLARESAGQYDCYEGCLHVSGGSDRLVLEYTSDPDRLSVQAGLTHASVRHRWRGLPDRAEEWGAPAADARGLVGIWVSEPWEKARLWSDGETGRLADWHGALSTALEGPVLLEFGRRFVDACPPEGTRHVIELLADSALDIPPDRAGARSADEARRATTFYFSVEERGDDFVLLDVTDRPPSETGWVNVDSCPEAEGGRDVSPSAEGAPG